MLGTMGDRTIFVSQTSGTLGDRSHLLKNKLTSDHTHYPTNFYLIALQDQRSLLQISTNKSIALFIIKPIHAIALLKLKAIIPFIT
ncbi:MAG: hypothetical protein RMZ43_031370 [Nostoc sp. CmiVER01]|uniref:hypothetical protein n=1 Tax=Nostoc sp. CmiVER01 TaxID=3075384 RepID=UPI002AD38EAB|nr:hypothetical protein [Nostoc sp. CmiVER01]MDZ8120594.1 hypothetical protein [Nostoc sp. CmiVER01]